MKRRQFGMSILAGVGALAFPFVSTAQTKALRVIVPFSAGSGSDEGSRFYAEQISKEINRAVVVENRPGASGLIAVKALLNEPADGNTILLGSNSLVAVNPVTVKNLGYDPFKDLAPLHGLAVSSVSFITGNESGINSIADIATKYKKLNAPISMGNYSEGYRLVSEWLAQELGIKGTPVPYKGGAQMVTDVIGNRLDMALNDITGILQLERSKQLKVLAITGDTRDKQLPLVPTMKELGYPDFESYVWSSFYMKAGTPMDIMSDLAAVISKVQNSEGAEKYQAQRAGSFLRRSLGELGDFQHSEYLRFKKIAEQANILPA